MSISALRSARDELAKTARAVLKAHGVDPNRDDEANWSRLDRLPPKAAKHFDDATAEIERLNAEIARKEKSMNSARHARPVEGDGFHRSMSMGTGPSFDFGDGVVTRALRTGEHLAAAMPAASTDLEHLGSELGLGGLVRALAVGPRNGAETKAMSEGTGSAGGFLVPNNLSGMFIDLARAQARVLEAGAMTLPIYNGNLSVAKLLGDPVAGWKAENADIADTAGTIGRIEMVARTLAATIPISIELLEDAPNAASVIQNALVQRMALQVDKAALYGDGTQAAPRGLKNRIDDATDPVNSILMGTNGNVPTSYSQFSQALSVIAGYNADVSSAAMILSPRTAGTLDRLVDSLGQPMRPAPSVQRVIDGGRSLTTNQISDANTVGSGTDCSDAFIGDFRQLIWGVNTQLTVEVTRDGASSGYNAFKQLGVIIRAYLRCDFHVAQGRHFAVLQGIKA